MQYAGLAFVLILAVAAYSGSLGCSFHFDDYHSIVENPNIRSAGNIPRFFTSMNMGSGDAQGYGGYRPLVTASLALNYLASGLQPWSYHVFNIAVHLGVTAVIFYLTLFLAGQPGRGAYAATLAAGLFALHPAHTNAVTYIIARSALICTFFYLLSFYLYVRFRASGKRAWAAASLVSFAAALLSKELAVTLPLVVLLYELLVKRDRQGRSPVLLAVFFIAGTAYAAAKYAILVQSGRPEGVQVAASRIMAQPWVLADYLRLFVFPVNLNFYPDPPVPASFSDPAFILPMVFIAVCLALIAYLSRKDGLSAFCLAWFFVTLIPETFVNLREPMQEYRLYLPSAGLAIMVSAAAARLYGPAAARKVALAVAALLLFACFAGLTFDRNKAYADDVTLWSDAVGKSPRSGYAHAVLGGAFLDLDKNADAVRELTLAFSLNPNLPGLFKQYNNLALALEGIGDNQRAYELCMKSLALAPRDVKVLTNLGFLCLRLGKREEARLYFNRVLALEPDNEGVLGVVGQMGDVK